jgi:hypothetical protein
VFCQILENQGSDSGAAREMATGANMALLSPHSHRFASKEKLRVGRCRARSSMGLIRQETGRMPGRLVEARRGLFIFSGHFQHNALVSCFIGNVAEFGRSVVLDDDFYDILRRPQGAENDKRLLLDGL